MSLYLSLSISRNPTPTPFPLSISPLSPSLPLSLYLSLSLSCNPTPTPFFTESPAMVDLFNPPSLWGTHSALDDSPGSKNAATLEDVDDEATVGDPAGPEDAAHLEDAEGEPNQKGSYYLNRLKIQLSSRRPCHYGQFCWWKIFLCPFKHPPFIDGHSRGSNVASNTRHPPFQPPSPCTHTRRQT